MAERNSTEGLLFTPPLRLSYPHLHVPRVTDQEKPDELWCDANLIIDAVSKAAPGAGEMLQRIIQTVRMAAVENAKDAAQGYLTKVLFGKQDAAGDLAESGIRSPFKDGSKGKLADKPGYGPGTIFFNIKSKFPIPCVDRALQTIAPDKGNAAKMYAGCYVVAALRPRYYNHPRGGKGVSLDAQALQLFQDGERLDTQVDASKLFAPLDAAEPNDVANLFSATR